MTRRARPRCTAPGRTSTRSSPTTTRASTRSPGRRCRRSASTRRRSTASTRSTTRWPPTLADHAGGDGAARAASASKADADAAGAAMATARRRRPITHLDHEEADDRAALRRRSTDHPAIKEMGKKFSRRPGHREGRRRSWPGWRTAPPPRRRPGCAATSPGRWSTIIGGLFGRGYRKEIAPVWASPGSRRPERPIGWGLATPIERGDMTSTSTSSTCSCCGARRSPSWRSSPCGSRRAPGCRPCCSTCSWASPSARPGSASASRTPSWRTRWGSRRWW